jgi:mannose-6-phosphate isomerase-like protein (cupin superfamily)
MASDEIVLKGTYTEANIHNPNNFTRRTNMTGYVGPIEEQTLGNDYFRQVLFTGQYTQLVVMCLQPGEEIGNEVHQKVDQFFRIEDGEATFILGGVEKHQLKNGEAEIVPAGTYHNVINASKSAKLKLYTHLLTTQTKQCIKPKLTL